jgi:hypothetical protein
VALTVYRCLLLVQPPLLSTQLESTLDPPGRYPLGELLPDKGTLLDQVALAS